MSRACAIPKESRWSQTEIGQPRMIRRAGTERPEVFAVSLFDREIVDAGDPAPHQAVFGKLPVLVAVGAKPAAGVVVPFVGEAHGNAIVRESPQLLDQPVVELAGPFAAEKRNNLCAALDELGTIAPKTVQRIGER